MTSLLSKKQNRREFLRGIMRYSILGGLISASGGLITRRKLASAKGEAIDISICQNCTFLRRCDQPAALLAKGKV